MDGGSDMTTRMNNLLVKCFPIQICDIVVTYDSSTRDDSFDVKDRQEHDRNSSNCSCMAWGATELNSNLSYIIKF